MAGIIGHHRAAVAEAAQVFLDDEAGAHRVAQLAEGEIVAARAQRLRVVFDDQELVLLGDAPRSSRISAGWP